MIKHNNPSIGLSIIPSFIRAVIFNQITSGSFKSNCIKNFKRIFKEDPIFTSSGSLAFFYIIKILKPNKIWLPRYSCISLTRVAHISGLSYGYYSDELLHLEAQNFLKGDIVLVINTFGQVHSSLDEIKKLESRGIMVVEDLTHGMDLEYGLRSKVGFLSMGYTKLVNATNLGVILGIKESEGLGYGDFDLSQSMLLSYPSNIDFIFLKNSLENFERKLRKRKILLDAYLSYMKKYSIEYLAYTNFKSNEIPYRFVIKVDNADRVIEIFQKNNIQVHKPIWNVNQVEGLDSRYRELVSLPFHEKLANREVRKIVRVLSENY